jgi:FkbM family methyltransferase
MDKIISKSNKNNLNIEDCLEYKFDKQVRKMREYHKYTGPGITNKLLRLLKFPIQYFKYLLISKPYLNIFLPRKIKINTFFVKNFYIGKKDRSQIFKYGILCEHENKLTKYFIKNIKNKKCLYDVGTNYGYYSILARQLSKTIEIHAFEPEPETFKILKKNSDNNDIKISQLAVSNKNQTTVFYKNNYNSSIGSLVDPNKNGFKKIEVEAITLDDYTEENNNPDIIKMDIEGAEELAIKGAASYLKNNSPEIIIEVWSKEHDDYKKSYKAIDALQNLNYKAYEITNNGEIKNIINLQKFLNNQTIIKNLLFKKNE